MVNLRSHATVRDREPAVKKEECKEITEAEVNQSPRSSISDGSFSSKKDEMPSGVGTGCDAHPPTSSMKLGSSPKNSRTTYDDWDTPSQGKRKRNTNTYSAIKHDAPLGAAVKKLTSGSDNIRSDHQQGNKRKKSPSLFTQGRSVETCLYWLFAK